MNDTLIFDQWNIEKKIIHAKELLPDEFFINPREIWFIKMGKNIGFEENGKEEFARPVLVIKKVGNLFFTVALTTKGKSDSVFYHQLSDVSFIEEHTRNQHNSYAILSQSRTMDKRRFLVKIGQVSMIEFNNIKQKLTELLL